MLHCKVSTSTAEDEAEAAFDLFDAPIVLHPIGYSIS